MWYCMCQIFKFSRYTSLWSEAALFSAVLFVTTVYSVVRCTSDTLCTAGLSCYPVITEYTYDEYCDILLNIRPALLDSNTRYALLYIGRRHPDANGLRQLEERLHETEGHNTFGSCECRSSAHCTDTSQWRCHNWSCGTRAVEKLTLSRTRTGTIPTKVSRRT